MKKIDLKELYFADINYLKMEAEKICLNIYGNKIFIRGLLEFSNECKMNCLYCGLRKDNKKIKRYIINKEEVIKIIKHYYFLGFRTFVLQSGEFVTYKIKDLCYILEKIKKDFKNIALTLSCGYFNKKILKTLKNAGADRYLLRFEVADKKIYSYLKNNLSLKKRIEMLYNLKELNFEVGSGFMIGLPYETDNILLENLKLCKDLQLDMIGIGPFIPHPDTPLKKHKISSFEKILKMTALLRIILPYSNIPATTATRTVYPQYIKQLLKTGTNVLMFNITPYKYKINYVLYPNKKSISDININYLNNVLKSINREISFDIGKSINFTNRNGVMYEFN